MRLSNVVVITLVITVAGVSLVHAQEDGVRSGFWLNGGVGWGMAWASIERLGTESVHSVVFHLRSGATVSSQLLVGAEVSAMPVLRESRSSGFGPSFDIPVHGSVSVLGVVLWYPYETGGLFFKGGAGFADGYLGLGAYTWDESSWTAQIGLGYDLTPTTSRSVSPYVTLQIWPAVGGGTVNLLIAGIGMTKP